MIGHGRASASSSSRDLLGEPELPDSRVCMLERAGALADRALVVGEARAVRRADLDEPAPARAITSGTRKPPLISTSSSRDTTTSRPGPPVWM